MRIVMRSHPNCMASIATIGGQAATLFFIHPNHTVSPASHGLAISERAIRAHSANECSEIGAKCAPLRRRRRIVGHNDLRSIFKRFSFCRHLAVRRVRVSAPRPPSQYITFNFFTLFRSAHVFSSACCAFVRRTARYVARGYPK